jgi:hypothetical protein
MMNHLVVLLDTIRVFHLAQLHMILLCIIVSTKPMDILKRTEPVGPNEVIRNQQA